MIDVEDVITRASQDTETEAEDILLFMPSGLNRGDRTSMCTNNIAAIKGQLREAQCRDALVKLRNYLHTRAHFIKHRNVNIRGQKANTRANTLIDTLSSKIRRAAEKYRAARSALRALRGAGPWKQELRVLQSTDICGPTASTSGDIDDANDIFGSDGCRKSKKQREASSRGLGEGYRTTSWIWACGTIESGEAGITDGKLSPLKGIALTSGFKHFVSSGAKPEHVRHAGLKKLSSCRKRCAARNSPSSGRPSGGSNVGNSPVISLLTEL